VVFSKNIFPAGGGDLQMPANKNLNPVISILPQAEEKSFALSCFKISQSLSLLRNDILITLSYRYIK